MTAPESAAIATAPEVAAVAPSSMNTSTEQRTGGAILAGAAVDAALEPSLALVTIKNFVSGIVGGGCESVVGYPLETVKARMQTQKASSGRSFSGPVDCLQQSIRDGGVSSLYRGASPQIFRSAVSASVLFGLMGQYRYFYGKYVFDDNPRWTLVAASTTTGFTEAFLYTPFEVVKLRMQTQYAHARTRITNWQCVQEVYARNGIRGMYRGFAPFAQREMLGNTAYFMAYETGKEVLLNAWVRNSPELTREQERLRTYQAIACAGGYAGFMYWLAIFPVDTVKSVMQTDHLDKPRYSGVLDCCRQLYAEGGAARFYRGISPSLVRAFPANAITFVAFETCMSFLNKHF